MLKKMSLKWKILIIFILTFVLTLLACFAYFAYQSYWLNVTANLSGLMNFADAKQQGVIRFIDQNEKLAKQLADLANQADSKTLRRQFSAVVTTDVFRLEEHPFKDEIVAGTRQIPTWQTYHAIDYVEKGVIRVSSEKMREGTRWDRAINLDPGYSDPYFDGLIPVVTFAGLARNGTVYVHVDARMLTNIVNGEIGNLAGDMGAYYLAGVGKTFDYYIVNKDNLLITEARTRSGQFLRGIGSEVPWRTTLQQAGVMCGNKGVYTTNAKCTTGCREAMGFYIGPTGKKMLGASMPFYDSNWTLVVEQEANELLIPLWLMLLQVIGVMGLMGIAAAYICTRMLDSVMLHPLKQLNDAMARIEAGEFGQQIQIDSDDEIGRIGQGFNGMSEKIEAGVRSLEHRVDERTRELNVTNEQLQEEIIEREFIEKSLRESQAAALDALQELHYQKFALDQHAIVVITDAQRNFIYVNEMFCKISGYSQQELLGKSHRVLNSGVHSAEFFCDVHNTITSGRVWNGDICNRAKNGHLYWEATTIVPYLDDNGIPLRYIEIRTDITERKDAEEELFIAAVAFDTHDAILITDAKANIIRVNRAFTEITGYCADEVLGKNPKVMSSGRQDKAFYAEMWQCIAEKGAWSGEIWDRRKNGEVYPKWLTITAVTDRSGEVVRFVGNFSDITARKVAEEEIRNLAFYDALTQLPNRRLFQDRFLLALQASTRYNDFGAVLFIDLDRFKMLNDTLGHDYGDLLLIEVAARIKSCVREIDTVARLGGDEFVVILESISSEREDASHKAGAVAEKIRESLSHPYKLKEYEHYSSPSIGISLFHGDEESMDELLKHADAAMYQAKNAGRNAARFYDPSLQQDLEARATLENDLRRAIESNELHLHYQVQVDGEHRPIGVEALLRWIHPQRGMVSPAKFIPVAEDSSLILEIGNWVLATACAQLAVWANDERMRHLTMAINVSAHQFRARDFVEHITGAIRGYGVEPAHLKLELTESVVLNDLAEVAEKMAALKRLGVQLSLDDFGTGYSSLAYLKRLPLDQLKIDQSFIRDITIDQSDAGMVQTIIDMAKNFNQDVIAEGVETEAQLAFLKHHDCKAYQGFFFSKPIPEEELRAMMDKLR